MSNLLSAVLAVLSGWVLALFAEPVHQRIFGPRLELVFKDTEHFVTHTKEGTPDSLHEAIYVRVKVTNVKWALAKACRAYLVNVERRGSSGQFEATEYCESLQLAWSAQTEPYRALDLPRHVPHFVDVVSTRDIEKDAFRLHIAVPLFRLERLWRTPGTYRFTILVSGDGVRPERIQLCFTWSDHWNDFKVSQA
jgi:hypothetical protein